MQYIPKLCIPIMLFCIYSIRRSKCKFWSPSTTNISRTLVGNKIVDHLYVVRPSPVGFDYSLIRHLAPSWLQWIGQIQLYDDTPNIEAFGFGTSYIC